MPCFSRGRGGPGPRPHRAAAATRASTSSGCPAPTSTTANTGLAPGVTLGASYAARRRLHRRTAQRAGLHRGADRARRRRPRTLHVHRPAHRGRPRGRRRHLRRADRHRPRRAHRRPEARRGRRDGRRADPGGRRAPPGGGDRTGAGVRRARGADGVRPHLRNLLAARRSRRPAVGHEQPRRGAGRGGRLRRHLLPEGPRPDRGAAPRHQGPGPAQDVGGDDRLHPRPPADPRPAAHRRRSGRRAPWSPAPPDTA